MGIIPGPEKDKFFAQDLKDLTLVKAVESADSARSACRRRRHPARPDRRSAIYIHGVHAQPQPPLQGIKCSVNCADFIIMIRHSTVSLREFQ